MKSGPAEIEISTYAVGPESQRRQILRYAIVAVILISGISTSLILVPGANGVMGAALAALMLLIAVIDARSYRIPNELTIVSFVLGVFHETLQNSEHIGGAIAISTIRAAAVAAVFCGFFLIYRWLRGREGLGLGDVKLAGVAGAWLDTTTIPLAIEAAAVSGLAIYLIRQWILGRPIRTTDRLPFGVFLAPAIWFGWMFEIIMADKF